MPWLRYIPVVLALAVGGSSAVSAQERPADQGRRILERDCSTCHAVGLEGASKLPIAPPFRDIARRYPPAHLAEALAEGIVTGHKGMPEFSFTPQEIGAIIAHLETLRIAK